MLPLVAVLASFGLVMIYRLDDRFARDQAQWFVIGLAAFVHDRRPSRLALGSAGAFAMGIVVFAGTLYAMALGAPRWLGAVTPIGGMSLLAAWAMLGVAALRR